MSIVARLKLVLGTLLGIILLIGTLAVLSLKFIQSLALYYPNELMPGVAMVQNMSKIGDQYFAASLADTEVFNVSELASKGDSQLKILSDQINSGPDADNPLVINAFNDLNGAWQGLKVAGRGGVQSEVVSAMETFQTAMNTADEVISALINAADSQIQGLIGTANSIVLTVAIMALALGVGVAVFLQRVISSGVRSITERTALVGRGDLTTQFDLERKDEFGDIGRALNELTINLRDAFASIKKGMAAATSDCGIVKKNSQGFVQRSSEQSDRAIQIATAMNEMASTIKEVAQNSNATSSQAATVNQEALDSNKDINKNVSLSDQLTEQISSIGTAVNELEESAQAINTVIDVIQGIAEQTNLLALNAAIEAARAGEQGRGFAVVADEVRTLASKTAESTSEIVQVIEKLQTTAQNTAKKALESSDLVGVNAESVMKVASNLRTIIDAIGEINEMNASIATATEEQSAVAEEMNQSITYISNLAEQTSTDANEVIGVLGQITEQVIDTQKQLDRFKV